jgi:hypothetical protein
MNRRSSFCRKKQVEISIRIRGQLIKQCRVHPELHFILFEGLHQHITADLLTLPYRGINQQPGRHLALC